MSVASAITQVLPGLESTRNLVRESWDRLHKLPGGTRAFSRLVGWMAPYTGTIGAHVVELRPDYARVELEDRTRVRNHLRSIHAVALANLAELTGNVAVAYSLPDDARFIVAGMSIAYLEKARGTITAETHQPLPRSAERREYEVAVELRNASGATVARAKLRTLVGPKVRRA